jgi:hypothetical protein
MGIRCIVVVVLVALVVVPTALADYGMVVRKTHVRPGELMTIWGSGCRHPRFRLGGRAQWPTRDRGPFLDEGQPVLHRMALVRA